MYREREVQKILSESLKRFSDMRYREEYREQAELAVEAIRETQKAISELENISMWCPVCGYRLEEG